MPIARANGSCFSPGKALFSIKNDIHFCPGTDRRLTQGRAQAGDAIETDKS
jgi:hypothetical protein